MPVIQFFRCPCPATGNVILNGTDQGPNMDSSGKLLDGGLSDNLDLRGPFQAVTTTDSPWSILTYANLDRLGRLMVITANAKTAKQRN